ncbi:MAG: cytochrome C oxidase subunit II [Chloroflexi bacterium]|nr:cytochrome C oxidase subunit II [Chloroflexota bacterium]
MSSLASPERVWWKPLTWDEKLWVTMAVVFALGLFAFMFIWMGVGKQNIPTETYRVSKEQFSQASQRMVDRYKVREESGVPVVSPPPGSDVYLVARTFQWAPILQLKKGQTYRLHLSSMDFQHGFSVQPGNLNLMVIPGYDFVATITPDKAGTFTVVCNEFCGLGHQAMVGKIIVTE